MNILLPESFECYDKDGNLEAEIRDNILYIYRHFSFRRVMYDITYKIYGNTCMYCGKKEANSIDHRIPQDFGGPTITNNLYPSCKDCNNKKANMLEEEYYHWMSLDKEEREEYNEELKAIHEDMRYGTISAIPKEWIQYPPFNMITVNFYIKEPLGAKYNKLRNFFDNYKKHKNPIIISGNGVLLDGFNQIFIGKEENRPDYDQIVLENVIVARK